MFEQLNATRAQGRSCGGKYMPAAPAVTWNGYLAAAAKALACGGLALLGAAHPAWRNRQIMRAALHVGAAARLGGARQIEIYGTAPGRSDSALRPGPGGS